MTTIASLNEALPAVTDIAPAKPARRPKTVSPADPAASDAVTAPKPASKIAVVVDLLRRDDGATLAEMGAVTGWLPHTTRAALTGLRKKGYAIARGTRDGVTAYTIKAAA